MLKCGLHPTGPSSPTGRVWKHSSLMPIRWKGTSTRSNHRARNSQSPLTQGSSREGCLLPWPEPRQATVVLGEEKAATHGRSLINTVNGRREPRVTFIHYPPEGQRAQTSKRWVLQERRKRNTRRPQTDFLTLSPPDVSHSPPTHIRTNTLASTLFTHTPSPPDSLPPRSL